MATTTATQPFLTHELPDLEQTITEIVVELLLLEKEHRYPNLLLADPENKTSVRISMHYIMALLSYGFAPGDPELRRVADWFDRPFPRKKPDYIDTMEMNRLMVTLHLRPTSEHIQPRLEQLYRQRERVRNYFDVQPGWSEFDTLWALEAFITAHQAHVLDEQLVAMDDIRTWLDTLIMRDSLRNDKDIALALRLRYEAFGGLEPIQEEKLAELLEIADSNNGVWGLRELEWQKEDMQWFKDFIEGRPLSYDNVKTHQQVFRKVILSTCMVIENLVPLLPSYLHLREPLERAIHMWWAQFRGQNAVTTLYNVFPKPYDYDYLLVLCRTLRAVKAYIGQPLRTLDTVYLLRQLTELRTNTNETYEVRSIKKALRNWIQIDIASQIERLRLGYSDANVVRITPQIWSPLYDGDDDPESLIRHSLVIKYGPADVIQVERVNYEATPAATRDFFVRIPEASYTDPDSGLAFVIMQDLRDYKTLYEIHEAGGRYSSQMADQLGNFLERMHEGGSGQVHLAPRSLLRDIYLNRMLEHVDRIFNFVWENNFQAVRPNTRDIQYELFTLIGDLIAHQRQLEEFPAAYMHGDLHMRNIMVTGLNGDHHNRRHGGIIFKLIDLEYLRPDGDAAFDAGELLIDLALISREENKLAEGNELQFLRDTLAKTYREFSTRRRDDTFDIRIELAKARALMRIAKGKTKRGGSYASKGQIIQAESIAGEVIDHAGEALSYLHTVVSAIR